MTWPAGACPRCRQQVAALNEHVWTDDGGGWTCEPEALDDPCPECFPWRPEARESYRCVAHRPGRKARHDGLSAAGNDREVKGA